jgi:DNA (cytosine-5)-methyltransferase 1
MPILASRAASHGRGDIRAFSARMPTQTITAAGGPGLLTPFLARQQHGGGASSVKDPVNTLCASPKDQNQIAVVHVAKMTSGGVGSSANQPFPTVTACSFKKRPGGNPPLGVSAVFLAQNNGGMVGHGAGESVSTINGKGANQSLVSVGLAAYFESLQDCALAEGMHTITTKDRFALWAAELGIPVLTPELAKKARRVARFLRQHGVKVEGQFAMCGEFVIVDIGMRMLTARELYRAQGFGEDYIIDFGYLEDGKRITLTKTAQVKMCGNSVCPPMAEALFRLNLPAEHLMKEAA